MLGLLFGSFFALLILGVPILFSMALSAGVYFVAKGIPLMQFVQKIVGGVDSFTVLSIPFFLLAGDIMKDGGISRRMLRFANAMVGHLTGGLAVTSVVSCALFGTICGSAPATAASIGGIVVPEMLDKGYKRSFVGAVIACSGLLGLVIPPSIIMVMFGATAGISIGSMFLGGFLPGILFTFLLSVYCVWQSKKHGYGADASGKRPEFSWKEVGASFADSIMPLTTPLFIMGSITLGIATATEAAVISVVWSMFLAMVVYRETSVREMATIFANGVCKAGQIIGIMAVSAAFGYALTIERVPVLMANFFVKYINSVWGFFLIAFVIVFILGCFLETIAIIVLVTPILMPIATAMRIDMIHFGLFMTLALTISGITPPVGLCLITTCRIVDTSIDGTFPELLHCVLIACVATLFVAMFPSLSTWLPSVLM